MIERCLLCGGASARELSVPSPLAEERRFTVAVCAACGSLWLTDPPADLAPYYPADYYAYRPLPDSYWRSWLAGRLDYWADRLGPARGRPRWGVRKLLGSWLGQVPPYDTRILDVGCGAGWFLLRLRQAGYRGLTGLDPYLPAGVRLPCPLVREPLEEHRGLHDLIFFHDSLEHVADPVGTLTAAVDRLAPGGRLVVRIPRVSSAVFEEYGDNWYGIDAPRHYFVPTDAGLEHLARRAGLTARHRPEADPLEFQWSELARRGVRGHLPDPAAHLTPGELAALLARAEEAAAAGRSGRLLAVLARVDDR